MRPLLSDDTMRQLEDVHDLAGAIEALGGTVGTEASGAKVRVTARQMAAVARRIAALAVHMVEDQRAAQ